MFNKVQMGETRAKFWHCVCSACMLRTQKLRYSPKNTYHLSSSTAKQQSRYENNEATFKFGIQLRLSTSHLAL